MLGMSKFMSRGIKDLSLASFLKEAQSGLRFPVKSNTITSAT